MMMSRDGLLLLLLLSPLAGCASHFVLTDDSAMDKLMKTRYVADLQRRNPSLLICFVEGIESDARDLYLGEDHSDHTVRLRACRVTPEGHVWVNSDYTLLENRWVNIE